MYETINEEVDVITIFGKGYNKVRPFRIIWHDREYTLTQIGYKHKIREGRKILHLFSCTDGSTFFELRFDAADLKWILGKTWDGEAT